MTLRWHALQHLCAFTGTCAMHAPAHVAATAASFADMCDKLPGCAFAPAGMTAPGAKAVCLSKYAASLDKNASAAFAAQLRNLDPAVSGTCEAACFLRQVPCAEQSRMQVLPHAMRHAVHAVQNEDRYMLCDGRAAAGLDHACRATLCCRRASAATPPPRQHARNLTFVHTILKPRPAHVLLLQKLACRRTMTVLGHSW